MAIISLTTYKISRKSLLKFKKKGLSEKTLNELATLEEQLFDTIEELKNGIKKLSQSAEILANEEQLIKFTKGHLRLDRIIPHRATREWVEALIFALVVASFVRTFIVAPFKIPSGSMIPTIAIGDHIFAKMYSYGLPIPFAEKKLFIQPINRGDIVIFPYPVDPSVDYIKRVVGLGGETIKVVKDKVYINDEPLDESYAFFDPDQKPNAQAMTRDGNTLQILPVSTFGPVKIPPDKLIVMGDNRYNSADSRFWGYVDVDQVKGQAWFIYWSHDPNEGWFGGYHVERILQVLK